jgi:hypothetical protein
MDVEHNIEDELAGAKTIDDTTDNVSSRVFPLFPCEGCCCNSLSRSLPHYSLTLTTTNHSQNTTLHSDTHDPSFESEHKGITHQATQDQTLQENPGSASFMSGPIENLKSFGTLLRRPTTGSCLRDRTIACASF